MTISAISWHHSSELPAAFTSLTSNQWLLVILLAPRPEQQWFHHRKFTTSVARLARFLPEAHHASPNIIN